MNNKDILIIGAGIAGISAAIYLKRSNKDFVILDKGAPGGKLNNIHLIENYPGYTSISGPDLAMALFSQITSLGCEVEYGNVLQIKQVGKDFEVYTDNGDYHVKAIIIATGVINKVLGIPGEKAFLGKGVSYCGTCDGNFYRNKVISVYGNNDHVVSEVAYLASLASELNFIIPENKCFTEDLGKSLKQFSNIHIYENAKLLSINGAEKVESIEILYNENKVVLPTSAIFPLFGEESSTDFLSDLNIELNRSFIKVNEKMASSVEGIFAAGDIVDKTLRQAITASSDGAIAATSCISYLNRRKTNE